MRLELWSAEKSVERSLKEFGFLACYEPSIVVQECQHGHKAGPLVSIMERVIMNEQNVRVQRPTFLPWDIFCLLPSKYEDESSPIPIDSHLSRLVEQLDPLGSKTLSLALHE